MPGGARHAVNVNGGERQVEHPQRGAGRPQAGQRFTGTAPVEPATGTSSNPPKPPACASYLRETRAPSPGCGKRCKVLPRRQAGFIPGWCPITAGWWEAVARGGVRPAVRLAAVRAPAGQQAQRGSGFRRRCRR